MIHFKNFIFASPPRTGSTWFLHAAADCNLGESTKTKVHIPFPPDQDYRDFAVSLVRHPYDWLVSYHLSLSGGAVGVPEVDVFSEISKSSRSVDEFIRRCLDECPGAVSRMFDAYQAHTVLRLEDFPWCVIEFFESIGVKRKYTELLKTKPKVNGRSGEPHRQNRDLRRKVVVAENVVCDRYNYF